MEPDDLLCSRNARSRTPLVGRAQWKISQPPSLRENEQAWKGDYALLDIIRSLWQTPPPHNQKGEIWNFGLALALPAWGSLWV